MEPRATEPNDETTEPNDETTEPNDEPGEPNDEPGDLRAAEITERNSRTAETEPNDETTEPNDETTEPNDETTEPNDEPGEPNDEPGDSHPVVGQIYRLTCRHAKKVVEVECKVAGIQGECTTFRLCGLHGDSLRKLVFLIKNSPNCKPCISLDSTDRPYPTQIQASECMIRLDHIYADKRQVCAIDALKWVEARMLTSTFMDMRS